MTRAVITSTALTGHVNFRTPTPKNAKCIGVGCSGSDPIWNLGGIAWIVGQVLGTAPTFDKCSTPGAPIFYHIDHSPSFGVYAWPNLQSYEYLHLGDNPNLDGLHDPIFLHRWAQRFWEIGNGGAGGEVLLWSLQPVFNADPVAMRARVLNFITEYDRAQDYCNARVPGGKRLVRQVPGIQFFLRLYEDQIAGRSPTPTWYADLYLDAFHMVYGKIAYMASVLGAAVMFGIDPMRMPDDMASASGFTIAEARYVKGHASAAIKAFARAGVDTSSWS